MNALGEPARGISKLTFMIVVEVDRDVGWYREAFDIYNSARSLDTFRQPLVIAQYRFSRDVMTTPGSVPVQASQGVPIQNSEGTGLTTNGAHADY